MGATEKFAESVEDACRCSALPRPCRLPGTVLAPVAELPFDRRVQGLASSGVRYVGVPHHSTCTCTSSQLRQQAAMSGMCSHV